MGIKARVPERKPLIEAGMYVARCYEIIHMGETFNEKFGKMKDGMRLTWELPTEMRDFDGVEKPIAVSKPYNLSMYGESHLRTDVEGWLGVKLSDEEADDYEQLDLLGKVCMLNIVHSEDGKYANVATVTPLMKGISLPPSFNEARAFDFEENFDVNIEDRFPEFIWKKIKDSTQWKERITSMEAEAVEPEMKHNAEEGSKENDLPY